MNLLFSILILFAIFHPLFALIFMDIYKETKLKKEQI